MKRLSSDISIATINIPAIVCAVVTSLVVAYFSKNLLIGSLIILLSFGWISLWIIKGMKKGVDEVWDCEDHLIVKRQNKRIEINYAEIDSIDIPFGMNDDAVSITFRGTTDLGKQIHFLPMIPRNNYLNTNQGYEDLVELKNKVAKVNDTQKIP